LQQFLTAYLSVKGGLTGLVDTTYLQNILCQVDPNYGDFHIEQLSLVIDG
jgi:hypothetical protein